MSYTKKESLNVRTIKSIEEQLIPHKVCQYNNSDMYTNPFEEGVLCSEITKYSHSKDKIWCPSCLLFLPFSKQKPICETTSTGVASHITYRQAILSGLLEVIERDAVMINFFQQLPNICVEIKSILSLCSPELQQLIETITKEFNLVVFKQHSDIKIPIYLCYIWNKDLDSNPLHYGIGASASLDSDEAILKAIKECLFTHFYSKNMMHLRKKNKRDINALYEHFLYYQNDNKFFQLIRIDKTEKYNKKIISEQDLLNSLKQSGLSVYYYDLTTSDIRKHTAYVVVKTIVPGMVDLNKKFNMRRLGLKRLHDLPRKIGFKVPKEINNEPHPFP